MENIIKLKSGEYLSFISSDGSCENCYCINNNIECPKVNHDGIVLIGCLADNNESFYTCLKKCVPDDINKYNILNEI